MKITKKITPKATKKTTKLSTTPPKGTKDRLPKEFAIRSYIFETRRGVCQQFGYQEYLTPLVENAEIYRAKSGEDVGGTELTLINDRGGRDIALRPEMTPSVSRMVASQYNQLAKPIRYFSIANFYRNEKPQRGRNREFRQCNIDLFGSKSSRAELEIMQMAIELMLAFNGPKDSFKLLINSRVLVDDFIKETLKIDLTVKTQLVRIMDKFAKLSEEAFTSRCEQIGCDSNQIEALRKFLEINNVKEFEKEFPNLAKTPGYQEVQSAYEQLSSLGYADYVEFSPSLMRGFDYYDGIVFEVFDMNPANNRAMFGGGRYNGLGSIFGINKLPAVGMAPGDETMYLYLESRGLLNQALEKKSARYYLPLLEQGLESSQVTLAGKLRNENRFVSTGLEIQTLNKAMKYADKNQFDYIVICESDEGEKKQCVIKDMMTGRQELKSL